MIPERAREPCRAEQFNEVRKALPEALRGVATFSRLTGWRIKAEVLARQKSA
jgi:hypothetical protein